MKVEINRLIQDKEYCKRVFEFFVKREVIKKVNTNMSEKYLNKSLDNLELVDYNICKKGGMFINYKQLF